MPAVLHRNSSLHNALRSASGRQQLRGTPRLAFTHNQPAFAQNRKHRGIDKMPITPRASFLKTSPALQVKLSGPPKGALRRSTRILGSKMSRFEARLSVAAANKPTAVEAPTTMTRKSRETGHVVCWVDVGPKVTLRPPNLPLLTGGALEDTAIRSPHKKNRENKEQSVESSLVASSMNLQLHRETEELLLGVLSPTSAWLRSTRDTTTNATDN